ncbi:MAG TPA: ABC transporter ATP-binding protein [Candidatus Copromorpha excrementigallinarum]|uniref:ABC transporter ATP-binding protein n=1 Tax=Candidatus Allocopromorpha excrementigallinarum TaxID=2840742 RepID=A0A9D1L6T6_9FIRM|nr:ABC transporter ATP-binding protein [Candidatus Copromorpha excrementigallinarum]
MSRLLEVKKLTKNYHDSPDSRDIIKDLDLTVDQGDFLCILGPSGCGKTTLIRCIAGFESYEGDILVEGKKVEKPGIDRIMVFQDFNQLFPWKTVKKNIQYPLKINGIKDKNRLEKIAQEHLDMVGLGDKGDLYPHQLSGGMKQRVAIAKGLALNPKIILMDEPFASLDAMTRNKLQAELLRIKEKENATVIFITHNIQEALVLGNRIMLMSKNGEIKIETENNIPKPVTPASEGYGQMWKMFNDALWEESDEEE